MEHSDATPRLSQLATSISETVAKLQAVLAAEAAPSPSFDEDASTGLSRDTFQLRDTLIDAASEIHDLLLEPMDLILHHGGHANSICLQTISRFHIAAMIPPGGNMSYEDISAKTGLSMSLLQHTLRHAMTMRIFREPEPGMVAHTRASRWLIAPHANSWMNNGTEDLWPASVRMLDAAQKWPNSEEANETGFSLADPTSGSIFKALGADSVRAARFSAAMKVFAESPGYDFSYILDHYDWASLGPAKVVDLGGSRGHISMALARRFENLDMTVQDMEVMIQGAEADVPEELKARVNFMPHDFFAPQPIEADVFYCRWIFHNWPDKYALIMLRSLIPALKPSSRLLIHESCMPERGEGPLWKEKQLRVFDLSMAALFNSHERTVAEWKALLAEADPRFELVEVIDPAGSALAILDVRWNDNAA